jgi:hypothetical protein
MTVVKNIHPIHRLWNLAIINLSLNGLILLLLIAGAVAHRPHKGVDRGPGWMPPMGGPRYGAMPPPVGGPGSGYPPPMGGGGYGAMPPPVGGPGSGYPPPREEIGRFPRGMSDMSIGPEDPPNPAAFTDIVLNHLTKELTLTDDERAKIKALLDVDQQKQFDSLPSLPMDATRSLNGGESGPP